MSACNFLALLAIPIKIPLPGLPPLPFPITFQLPQFDLTLPAPPGFSLPVISIPIPGLPPLPFPITFQLPQFDLTLPAPPGFSLPVISIPIPGLPGFALPFSIPQLYCPLDN